MLWLSARSHRVALAHLLSSGEALNCLGAATLNLFRSFGGDDDARRSLRRISRRVLA